jgi:hypothetical protein
LPAGDAVVEDAPGPQAVRSKQAAASTLPAPA